MPATHFLWASRQSPQSPRRLSVPPVNTEVYHYVIVSSVLINALMRKNELFGHELWVTRKSCIACVRSGESWADIAPDLGPQGLNIAV